MTLVFFGSNNVCFADEEWPKEWDSAKTLHRHGDQMIQSDAKSELIERFFRYAAIESQSDAAEVTLPSSTGQLKLARLLAEELLALGV
jgi:tripeptide aminopeptidase